MTLQLLTFTALLAGAAPLQNTPADVPVSAHANAPAGSDAERIDAILSNLQHRSEGLKDIRCRVEFVDDDRINLTESKKWGHILFWMTEPSPHFMIHFDRTVMDGVLGQQEWYLFDGRWLYEAVERRQQVTKQDLAPPGTRIDLFDLETAPFPLPFGQKKDTILKNFDVTLAKPAGDDPPNTDHLICVPKAESRLYRKYDRLELFILRDVHLPSRIVVTKNNGDEISTANFPDLSQKSINTGVSKRDFAKPRAWKNYRLVVDDVVPTGSGSP